MRQWPTDPNGFLKEGNSFFFHVEESWEWFSGRERCILDMNKQLFIRRSVLYCRKLLCCSALWHYPEVKVGKKSLGDWFSLYSNISLEMLLSPSLIFKFSGLKVSTREIRIVFWCGLVFTSFRSLLPSHFTLSFYHLILPLPVLSICRKMLAFLPARTPLKSKHTFRPLSEHLKDTTWRCHEHSSHGKHSEKEILVCCARIPILVRVGCCLSSEE